MGVRSADALDQRTDDGRALSEMGRASLGLPLAATFFATILVTHSAALDEPAKPTVRRLAQNPLITLNSSPSLGNNVNGPSIVRVPEWVQRPLGRYYMYFAHHMGTYIRLAYADRIEGPWRI